MEEFIKWCFRDEASGCATVIIGLLLGQFILEIIRSIKK
jgi:hypothetical protein